MSEGPNLKAVYFAGELFSLKHLAGNAMLAESIDLSGRYRSVLPQNLEQRECTAISIRDRDLFELAKADCAIFNFDGPDIDSGTVVEFTAAKFLDIPSIIIRTDFRNGGDNSSFPWNLMMNYYPRTEIICSNSMKEYQAGLAEGSIAASLSYSKQLASKIVDALDRVTLTEPIIKRDKALAIYAWFQTACGQSLASLLTQDVIDSLVDNKIAKGLIK